MKFVKKILMAVGVVAVLLVVVALASGGSSSKKNNNSSSSSTSSQEQKADKQANDDKEKAETSTNDSSADSDSPFTVSINGATVGEDYSGDPCIFVSYTFTNVSADEPSSFALEYNPDVYQNGIECDIAFADTDADSNYTTKIKAGSSVDVTLAYELQDTTSEVEVEVKELFSWDNEIIASQTFQIA